MPPVGLAVQVQAASGRTLPLLRALKPFYGSLKAAPRATRTTLQLRTRLLLPVAQLLTCLNWVTVG